MHPRRSPTGWATRQRCPCKQSIDRFDASLGGHSRPPKVDSSHLIELLIERSVEFAESPEDVRIDRRMGPTFRLAEAVRNSAPLGLLQAWKAFGGVEVKVLLRDDPLQAEEILDRGQLPGRIADQSLAVHEVDLFQGKVFEPARQMAAVDSDPDGTPGCVDHPGCVADEGHLFERAQVRPLADRLRVVGQGSSGRVTDDDDQSDCGGHVVDPGGGALRDPVTRGLLHRDLTGYGRRHVTPATKQQHIRSVSKINMAIKSTFKMTNIQ